MRYFVKTGIHFVRVKQKKEKAQISALRLRFSTCKKETNFLAKVVQKPHIVLVVCKMYVTNSVTIYT